ncbi:redoxin domain-containing protein [Nocardia sp. CDC159]|uniref:Redoxin domain-containing protein n=1 Tax=Nocardia pulmonis TaxID=2951408 RepID=A0A9X2EDS4_9NOCA|nr:MULTISPECIES: redoxin domain-containing protein [Nocardia]MCM6779067.1 redoxin domain-containing protein [Nocardia pulmonis]MCM6791957.1 redoxin domain-containing protein [Nocardia sp. CDC159]
MLAFITAAVLVVGCGTNDGQTKPTGSSSQSGGPTTSTATLGAPVPEPLRFTATTIDGEKFFGASLVGRPVVLWFWAPGCPVCQHEAPRIADAARAHPDTEFVGIAGRDTISAMREFVDEYDLPFPNLVDTDGTLWHRFDVSTQPTFVFVSTYTEVDRVPGTLSETELATRIAGLR